MDAESSPVTISVDTKKSIQEEEMERAKNLGLPVDFKSTSTHPVSVEKSQDWNNKPCIRRVLFVQDDDDDDDDDDKEEGGIVVQSSKTRLYYWPYGDEKKEKNEDELDRWEKKQANEEDDLLVDYNDSDDDLL